MKDFKEECDIGKIKFSDRKSRRFDKRLYL